MAYQSDISGRTIIDDRNFRDSLFSFDSGYVARDYDQFPEGTFAAPFNMPVIPREEWPERIEQMDKEKGWIKNHIQRAGMKVKNQQRTNYCWINAPVFCVEAVRVSQGDPYVELSPASVGAPIKGYRNVGGWGSQGVEYMAEHGVAPASLWPVNAISRQYDTEESRQERKKYIIDEWLELKPRNVDQMATCLLMGLPVAIGLNWWSHEVTAVTIAYKNGQFLFEIGNSWGSGYGEDGYAYLSESKARPDDAVVPSVVIT